MLIREKKDFGSVVVVVTLRKEWVGGGSGPHKVWKKVTIQHNAPMTLEGNTLIALLSIQIKLFIIVGHRACFHRDRNVTHDQML